MAQTSYLARQFIVSRLLDNETGFGYWVGQAATDYGMDPFILEQGITLFTGAYASDEMIQQAGFAQYPMAIVYSVKADNMNQRATPAEFWGDLFTKVDIYSTFPDGELPDDAESIMDLIEDAMYETFNNEQYYGLLDTGIYSGLTYNNGLTITRSMLTVAGTGLRQRAECVFHHLFATQGR